MSRRTKIAAACLVLGLTTLFLGQFGPFLCVAMGMACGVFAVKLPASGKAALILGLIPLAGVYFATVFC